MKVRPLPKWMIFVYAALVLTYAAAAARSIFQLEDRADLPILIGCLVFYLLLLVLEPFLVSRNLAYLHIINALQTGIALFLMLVIDNLDYFALLVIPPCTLSMLYFQRKIAIIWIGGIIFAIIAALLASFPIDESIGYIIIYPTASFLYTALSYLAKQAEEAKKRSDVLLADLQIANQKLQEYSAQVEELAAANERNRLARELHDSVTQIIFGLTLSAQAARILIDRDPARAALELDHLKVLAQSALAEMRELIQELHPHTDIVEGLVPALHHLAAKQKTMNGLRIDLQIKGDRRLSPHIEVELLCVAQEAVNNIVKHARSDRALITLDLENANVIHLDIEDYGIGFDASHPQPLPGHLGLTSMQERVNALGGSLNIESQPGKGTRVRVEITQEQEREHA